MIITITVIRIAKVIIAKRTILAKVIVISSEMAEYNKSVN